MEKRKIIQIDKNLCNGCGLCADACHEGAIGMVNGKAVLLRDDYCDGLGDCLPVCPTGAISFTEKYTLKYNEEEVKKNMAAKATKKAKKNDGKSTSGCPGKIARTFTAKSIPAGCPSVTAHAIAPESIAKQGCDTGAESAHLDKGAKTCCPGAAARTVTPRNTAAPQSGDSAPQAKSMLCQWPVQLKLVPVNASYLKGARLLIAADCSAFAFADFHRRFMQGRITLIGCPKLDGCDYSQKLTEILKLNDIKSVTVVRMEVPCCGGLTRAAVTALQNCGKMLPWNIVTLSVNGDIIDE